MNRRLTNVLLFFFTAIFFLLAAEAGYRFYVLCAKPLYHPSSVPGLGWDFTPGSVNANPGGGSTPLSYLINDRGFRDRTNGRWQPWTDTDLKIAVLGDSATAGANVSYAETYSAQLETFLQESAVPARVVNLGLDATNTRQHLALLKAKGLALKPQIVLLGYSMNDIEKRSFENFPAALKWSMRHFQLSVFLSQRIIQALRNHREKERYQVDFAAPRSRPKVCSGYVRQTLMSYTTPEWEENSVWLERIALLARSRQVGFGVVLFPFEEQVRGICPAAAQDRIHEFLVKKGIPFLDLLEAFRAAGPEPLYLAGDSSHLNKEGHRTAAKAISAWILTSKS